MYRITDSSKMLPHSHLTELDNSRHSSPRFDKLVIFDLDETLIYASEKSLGRDADFKVGTYYIYKRPYLDEIIEMISQACEYAVWTSAGSLYAKSVCDELFDNKHMVKPKFIWAGDRCTRKFDHETYEITPLKLLKKVKKSMKIDLEKIIMIDDSPEKHTQNYGNLVQVKPYLGEQNDHELRELSVYLEDILPVDNIRGIEKRCWYHATINKKRAWVCS